MNCCTFVRTRQTVERLQAPSKELRPLMPDEHAAKLRNSLAALASFHCETSQRLPVSRTRRHPPRPNVLA